MLMPNPRVRCALDDTAAWVADQIGVPERNRSYKSVSRRVLRRMESTLVVGVSRRVKVPSEFVVHLGPCDFDQIDGMQSFAADDLITEFTERARRHGWLLPTSGTTIRFSLDNELRSGHPHVTGTFHNTTRPQPATQPAATEAATQTASTQPVAKFTTPDSEPDDTADDEHLESATTRRPRFYLVTRDPGQASSIELHPTLGRIELGRLHQSDLHHPTVSATHCELVFHNGTWTIHDLASRHGTLVNGDTITERTLDVGDVIQLGTAGPRYVYTLINATTTAT